MAIEELRFGEHHLADYCPDPWDVRSLSGWARWGQLMFKEIEAVRWIRQFGLLAVRKGVITNDALSYLQEFIKTGGTQNEPLTTFAIPSVFVLNSYHPGTVIRFETETHNLGRSFVILRDWRRDNDQRYAFTGLEVRDDNQHLIEMKKSLGVVCEAPRGKSRLLLCFYGTEEQILNSKPKGIRGVIGWSTNFEDWYHGGGTGPTLFGETFFYHSFQRVNQVEILELGKPVRETKDHPLTNPSPVLRPAHVG